MEIFTICITFNLPNGAAQSKYYQKMHYQKKDALSKIGLSDCINTAFVYFTRRNAENRLKKLKGLYCASGKENPTLTIQRHVI